MRYVVVDDDAGLRGVIGALVASRGHTVVGEATAGLAGGDLVRTIKPDVVIIDLALEYGSGHDVVAVAREIGAQIIVFSAYLDDVDVRSQPGALLVTKPDFLGLETAMDVAASRLEAAGDDERGERRRRPPRDGEGERRLGVDATDDFYRALAEASAGDAMLSVDVHDEATVGSVVPVARAVLRSCDHLTVSGTQITMLLAGDGVDAHRAVTERLQHAVANGHEWSYRYTVIDAEEAPSDALTRLRAMAPT